MKVYRISKCAYVRDISGKGAALNGGRWNSEGIYMLYTAESASLAMLESLVHFGGRIRGAYCQLALDVPDHNILEIPEAELPANWRIHPAPEALGMIGNRFIKDGHFLTLKVPSVLIPREFNFLLNPGHPDFKKVRIEDIVPIEMDSRLLHSD